MYSERTRPAFRSIGMKHTRLIIAKHLTLIAIACLFLFACSPQKRLDRIVNNNPYLATRKVEIRTDTIEVVRDSIRISEVSVLKQNDTVIVERTAYKYQVIRLHDTIRVDVEVKPDTLYVPYTDTVEVREFTINDKLLKAEKKAIKKKARRWGFIFGLIVGSLTVLLIWQRKRILPLLARLLAGLPF